MLDLIKLDEEFDKILNSFTREQLLEWVEFDKKRMALARKEKRLARKAAMSDMVMGKLNGNPSIAAESKGLKVVCAV